ncbi:MAG: ABC transporter permease subunit [Aestuariibacter sp.]
MENSYLTKLQKKRIALDRRVAALITLGGWLILFTLLMLIWHLLSVTWPLLGQPEVNKTGSWSLPQNVRLLSAGNVSEREFVVWQASDCALNIAHYHENDWHTVRRMPKRCSDNVNVEMADSGFYIAEMFADSRFRVHHSAPLYDSADLTPVLSGRLPFEIRETFSHWEFVALPDSFLFIADGKGGHKYIAAYDRRDFSLLYSHQLTELALVAVLNAANQVIAFENGQFTRLGDKQETLLVSTPMTPPKAIYPLPGGNAFLTYDASGYLSKWALMRSGQAYHLENLYRVPLTGKLDNLALNGSGQLALLFSENRLDYFNTTTGEVTGTSDFEQDSSARIVAEADLIHVTHQGRLTQFQIVNSTAIVTFKSLWQEVWYEGYSEPAYVWQTSSALDNHQAKFSVVPLFIGSMKAAFLAVIVAIPVGIGCAIYVGYFARQKTRRYLKPTIELIEGIPSVVIGFIAAIWLLPLADTYLLALFLFLLLSPLFFGVYCLFKARFGHRWQRGWELLFVIVVLLLYSLAIDSVLTHQQAFIKWFWADNALAGVFAYNSGKNTIILAIALGFAIAPTVFSIAEDAINEVPTGLLLASFAMGADQVQTLQRVVLKAALPGILSAVMLGFARAFGETMIVLMISGNTPIADWNLFEGVRTLTANLAIELPEAELGSVHYQILFFTALLLFTFTFFINTFAELLRQRMQLRQHHD